MAGMVAVALDPAAVSIAVAGRGPVALRRFDLLSEAARDIPLFCDQPDALGTVAGTPVVPRLPDRSDLRAVRLLWIAGLPDGIAAALAATARSERVLVNVEDRPALCDFHSVAEVRRGALLLTVSTGGASPGLAARIRGRLAREFGPEWAERLDLLRSRRAAWRREGRDVATQTDALLRSSGWLS